MKCDSQYKHHCSGYKKGWILMKLSFLALLLATLASADIDVWLAGTQWILVAILFAVYALCTKCLHYGHGGGHEGKCGGDEKCGHDDKCSAQGGQECGCKYEAKKDENK